MTGRPGGLRTVAAGARSTRAEGGVPFVGGSIPLDREAVLHAVVSGSGAMLLGYAWFAWLTVHLFYLIGFENRLLVMVQWAASYVSYERGARLITGPWHAGAPTQESDP